MAVPAEPRRHCSFVSRSEIHARKGDAPGDAADPDGGGARHLPGTAADPGRAAGGRAPSAPPTGNRPTRPHATGIGGSAGRVTLPFWGGFTHQYDIEEAAASVFLLFLVNKADGTITTTTTIIIRDITFRLRSVVAP